MTHSYKILYCIKMTIPKPPGFKPHEKVVDQSEMSYLLDQYLAPVHRDDPNVLRFIANYLNCRSVSQAAHQSGLKPSEGRALRSRRDIHNVIVAITDTAVLKHGFDAAELVERMKEIAEVDPIELYNEDGSYKESLANISPEMRRAIKKLKVKNSYDYDSNGIRTISGKIIEVEFWDKMKATELLGREKDVFKETKKIEHTVGANMRDILLESKRLADERTIEMREVNGTVTNKK